MLDFSDTYDEYLPRVFGFIGYRVSSRADAEDLTQQTFERAFAHWGEYDSRRAGMSTWLLTIARNAVIDHCRQSGRRSYSVDLDEVPESEIPSGGAPEPGLGVSPELAAALATLGDRERDLVALRFGGDLTGPEIADVTGLTLANVQQILSRAMRKLRAELERVGTGRKSSNFRSMSAPEPGLDTDTQVG